MHKVLVTGDREWSDAEVIRKALARAQVAGATVLVEGEARGADKISRTVGTMLGYCVRQYPADWTRDGKRAGPLRNLLMLTAESPDVVLAFHDDLYGRSKGTKHMVEAAMTSPNIKHIYHFSHVTGWTTLKGGKQ